MRERPQEQSPARGRRRAAPRIVAPPGFARDRGGGSTSWATFPSTAARPSWAACALAGRLRWWGRRLQSTDLSDFPESLKRPQRKLSWSGAVIPDPHQPIETEWQPLPAKAALPVRPAPQGWLSAVRFQFRSEAATRVRAFQKKVTLWMAGSCERPEAVVIPGSWLEHWVFEAPHEFHSQPGYAVPINVCTLPGKARTERALHTTQF